MKTQFANLKRTVRRLLGRDWQRFEKQVRPPAKARTLALEIYSTYCHNVPSELVEMQARVFAHLGLPLTQVEFGTAERDDKALHRGHGETIEHLVSNSSADLLIFFDVDCIPLNRAVIEHCYLPVMLSGALIGPAQRAEHLGDAIFAAPCALGFARQLYKHVGSPALSPSHCFDVCGSFTYACEQRGVAVVKLPPVKCEVPKWRLYDSDYAHFGHGTTFAGGIYHAYEIRLGTTREMFMREGRKVLDRPAESNTFPSIQAIHSPYASLMASSHD